MKLMHLSDLHLGKRLMDLSLLEDQKYILGKILCIADEEHPDAMLICGDIYDRSVPPEAAVKLFDDFVYALVSRHIPLFIISGNHDSAERVAYANRPLRESGIYISPAYSGIIEPVTLKDEYGYVDFWLMPYADPETVGAYFTDSHITTPEEAVKKMLTIFKIDGDRRNVVLAHQFVQGAATSDSEIRQSVGTLEIVSPDVYAPFDYVALGHLHRPQKVGRANGTLRYCGSPLKYSKSELDRPKSVAIAILNEKGNTEVYTRSLVPLRELREVRGTFDELIKVGPEPGEENDLYFACLTDELSVDNAASRLRERFTNLLAVEYDNSLTREGNTIEFTDSVKDKTPEELLAELYEKQNGVPMSDDALIFVRQTIKKLGRDE